MKLNLSLELDKARFVARCNALLQKGAFVELTDKSGKSREQNSYEHLLMGIVAMEIGESLDYVKENYYKRLVNPDIFVVTKEDKILGKVEILRSSKELTKEETYFLTKAQDVFKMTEAVDSTVDLKAWCIYTDTDADGKEVELFAMRTEEGAQHANRNDDR